MIFNLAFDIHEVLVHLLFAVAAAELLDLEKRDLVQKVLQL